jgi:hypothetical protein
MLFRGTFASNGGMFQIARSFLISSLFWYNQKRKADYE